MKKILNIQTLIIIIILLLPTIVHAQPTDPGIDPDNAPVDGGLSLLVAGGIGYGVRKIKERKTKHKDLK